MEIENKRPMEKMDSGPSTRRVLFVDEKVMVSLFEASPGTTVPSHKHCNGGLARLGSLSLVHSTIFLAMRRTKSGMWEKRLL
jgi:hypothetical protein